MVIPIRGAVRRTCQVREVFWTATETSGGSNETEVNELAAMPIGVPWM
jgi:hypothetical protein